MNLIAVAGFALVVSLLAQYGAIAMTSKKIDGKNIVYMHEKSNHRLKKTSV